MLRFLAFSLLVFSPVARSQSTVNIVRNGGNEQRQVVGFVVSRHQDHLLDRGLTTSSLPPNHLYGRCVDFLKNIQANKLLCLTALVSLPPSFWAFFKP